MNAGVKEMRAGKLALRWYGSSLFKAAVVFRKSRGYIRDAFA